MHATTAGDTILVNETVRERSPWGGSGDGAAVDMEMDYRPLGVDGDGSVQMDLDVAGGFGGFGEGGSVILGRSGDGGDENGQVPRGDTYTFPSDSAAFFGSDLMSHDGRQPRPTGECIVSDHAKLFAPLLAHPYWSDYPDKLIILRSFLEGQYSRLVTCFIFWPISS